MTPLELSSVPNQVSLHSQRRRLTHSTQHCISSSYHQRPLLTTTSSEIMNIFHRKPSTVSKNRSDISISAPIPIPPQPSPSQPLRFLRPDNQPSMAMPDDVETRHQSQEELNSQYEEERSQQTRSEHYHSPLIIPQEIPHQPGRLPSPFCSEEGWYPQTTPPHHRSAVQNPNHLISPQETHDRPQTSSSLACSDYGRNPKISKNHRSSLQNTERNICHRAPSHRPETSPLLAFSEEQEHDGLSDFQRFLHNLQQEAALDTSKLRERGLAPLKPLNIYPPKGAISPKDTRRQKQTPRDNTVVFDPPADVEGPMRYLSQDHEKRGRPAVVHHRVHEAEASRSTRPTEVKPHDAEAPRKTQSPQKNERVSHLPSSSPSRSLHDRSPRATPQPGPRPEPRRQPSSQPSPIDTRHELVRFESFKRKTIGVFGRNGQRHGAKEDLITAEDMHRRNRTSLQEEAMAAAAGALRDDPQEMEERFGLAWDMLCADGSQAEEESIGQAVIAVQSKRISEVFDCYAKAGSERRVYWS